VSVSSKRHHRRPPGEAGGVAGQRTSPCWPSIWPAPGQGQVRPRSQVATELTAHDALAAHLDAELHIDPDDLAGVGHLFGTAIG
jgi:hypothetical protein